MKRPFGWLSRFRRLAQEQERLAEVLVDFHLVAFIMLMLPNARPVRGLL